MLLNAQQFDVKLEIRIGRDRRWFSCWAIGNFARDPDFSLAADLHRLQGLIPTLDHPAESELRRLAHLVGVIEFAAIFKPTDVVDSYTLTHFWTGTIANLFVVNLQAGSSCCFIHGFVAAAARDDVRHAGDHDHTEEDKDADSHILATRKLWGVGSGRVRMRYSRTFSCYVFLSMSTFWHEGEPAF